MQGLRQVARSCMACDYPQLSGMAPRTSTVAPEHFWLGTPLPPITRSKTKWNSATIICQIRGHSLS